MPEQLSQGIYIIRCVVTGKYYLGSSTNVECRWQQHRCDLKFNRHHSIKLQRAWNKYGADSFQFKFIKHYNGVMSGLLVLEQQYLDQYRPHVYGYNVNGNAVAVEFTPAVRLKIALANTGRVRTQEQQDYLTGRLRESASLRRHCQTVNTGRQHTTEARANMATAARKRGILKTTADKAHEALRGTAWSLERRAKQEAAWARRRMTNG